MAVKKKSVQVERSVKKNPSKQMPVRSPLSILWGFVIWLVGVLVSLAVGFGMIGQNGVPILSIWYVPDVVTVGAGWVVVVLTVIGIVLGLIGKFGK
tara:strand:+ start:1005 stop:1292 length:288 start_codon:yes stop_codon:yes gene_type:complete